MRAIRFATRLNFDIEKEIKETEASLCSMIDDLVGDEYDMKGLSELKSLLSGE